MISEDLAVGLYQVRRAALEGDEAMTALLDEIARLYDAAGERRPDSLGKRRLDGCVEYGAEPVGHLVEGGGE